jgi:hypothetical protein
VILYVNGDSHSAGAEAVNDYCFAEDDPFYYALGRIPHPDNERVSYGCNIANELFAILYCDAESASSNARIIRTTRKYLETNNPDFVIIGWSTWEREEWLHDGVYWQINAGGIGHDWPKPVKEQYQNYIVNLNWHEKTREAHQQIHEFHIELLDSGVPHLFFNSYNDFHTQDPVNWCDSYIDPYNPNMTYYQWLTDQGFQSNPSYHFGPDAHKKWAEFLLPYCRELIND